MASVCISVISIFNSLNCKFLFRRYGNNYVGYDICSPNLHISIGCKSAFQVNRGSKYTESHLRCFRHIAFKGLPLLIKMCWLCLLSHNISHPSQGPVPYLVTYLTKTTSQANCCLPSCQYCWLAFKIVLPGFHALGQKKEIFCRKGNYCGWCKAQLIYM